MRNARQQSMFWRQLAKELVGLPTICLRFGMTNVWPRLDISVGLAANLKSLQDYSEYRMMYYCSRICFPSRIKWATVERSHLVVLSLRTLEITSVGVNLDN